MAGVEDSKEGGRADTRGFLPLFAMTQALSIVSVILVITWCGKYLGGFDWQNPKTRFNWHPVLMVVAFVFLYGNGMLIYRLLRNEPKPRLKLIHAGMNGLAFLLAVIGLIAVFSFHNENKIPNMYSLHSWIGLGTVILFGLNLVGGATFFLLPQMPPHLRAVALPLHVYGGQAALLLIVASIVTGTTEKCLFKMKDATPETTYSLLPTEAYVLNTLGVTVVAFALVVGFTVSRAEYKRRPLSSETPVRLAMSESMN